MSSWSATAARTTRPRSRGPAAIRSASSSCGRVQARRPAQRRRGSEGFPAPLPGRRRVHAWGGGPRRAGAPAKRGARRPTADSIRDRAGPLRSCAATTEPDLACLPSSARSGGPGSTGSRKADAERFGAFPDVVADDLWVDRLFARGGGGDRGQPAGGGHGAASQPRSAAGARSYLPGKGEPARAPDLRDRAPETVGSTLRDLAGAGLTGPAAALDAATYAAFSAGARLALALPQMSAAWPAGGRWERDESSRAV